MSGMKIEKKGGTYKQTYKVIKTKVVTIIFSSISGHPFVKLVVFYFGQYFVTPKRV